MPIAPRSTRERPRDAEPPVPDDVRRREARAHGDRDRRGGRVGRLRRIQLARRVFAGFERHTALLVGAGEMIELSARHLHAQKIGA
jgi:hypothetical protein